MLIRGPVPTVDIIIEVGEEIVLIRRKHPPAGWAIPGGFIDRGERSEDAAIREAREGTGLSVTLTALLGVYSDPARGPPRPPRVAAASAPTPRSMNPPGRAHPAGGCFLRMRTIFSSTSMMMSTVGRGDRKSVV